MSGFGGLKRLEGAWGTWVGLEDLRGLRSLRGHEGLGLHLVEMLMFGWDFKVNAYLRFWNCNTYVQDLWTVNCDLVIWTQPSGPLRLWQCFKLRAVPTGIASLLRRKALKRMRSFPSPNPQPHPDPHQTAKSNSPKAPHYSQPKHIVVSALQTLH